MYIHSNLALTVFEEVVALSITLINTNTYFNAIIKYVSRYKRFNFIFIKLLSPLDFGGGGYWSHITLHCGF